MALRPVPGIVTQKFGGKNSSYRLGYHPGTDYRASIGTPVKAPLDGYATWHWSSSYGWVSALILANGDVLWFAHNSRAGKTGSVRKGDILAYSGNTGYSLGAHSHIEYRLKGNQDRVIDFDHWLRNNPEPVAPKPVSKMPPIGSKIRLDSGQTRTTFRAGTTKVAGHLVVKDNTYIYTVRAYDPSYPNRILINSKSAGGNGVALALFYTNGVNIGGWKQL